jgi:hypothetical protein
MVAAFQAYHEANAAFMLDNYLQLCFFAPMICTCQIGSGPECQLHGNLVMTTIDALKSAQRRHDVWRTFARSGSRDGWPGAQV